MHAQLLGKCKALNKEKGLKFDCGTTNTNLQEFIDKYSNKSDSSIESHPKFNKIDLDPSELDSAELQLYCNENINKCSDDAFWSILLKQNFPDISLLILDLEFPDLEKDIRDSRRKFLPLRELYSQLLVITSNPSQLSILDNTINNEPIDELINDKIDKDKDFIRSYYQLLSFLMARVSDDWKIYLVTLNDSLLEYIAFSIEELEYYHLYLKSSILTKRYLSLVSSNPAADANYAIRYVAREGYLEVVKLLLADPRVDPAAVDNYAIRYAAREGHLEVVKLLLTYPDVDPTAHHNEAIRYASREGHLEVVELLLTYPDVNPAARNNEAIRLAAKYGHTEVVKLLLYDPRVDPEAGNNEAIRLAAANGHTEVVKVLLAWEGTNGERVDPTAKYNEAIRFASAAGHTEIVKLLLENPGVDPGAEYDYAILFASAGGHTEVVKLLLEDERVDPTAKHNDAIRYASQVGQTEVVKLLLADPRVDPAADDNITMRYAAREGHSEVVKLLLAWEGAKGEKVDPAAQNNSAIRFASAGGHPEVVKLLGANARVQATLTSEEKKNYGI